MKAEDFLSAPSAEDFLTGADGSGEMTIPIKRRRGTEKARYVAPDNPDNPIAPASGLVAGFGFQAFINMGVNLGLLPTKGLTLPLMSYGGSGVVINCIGLAILLRIDYENRSLMRGSRK